MKKNKIAIILILASTFFLTMGWSAEEAGEKEIIQEPEIEIVTTIKIQEKLQTEDREIWLASLIACESRGNHEAINPKDRDGTPSYGLLQFKPSTFELFSKAYKIEGELMDPEAQKAIVRRMMDDESVRWETQFPACVRLLGRPPQL